MKDEVRGGSNFLFVLLKVLNLVAIGCGVVMVALGIWVWVAFSIFNPVQIILILFGLIECLTTFVGWSSRNSIKRYHYYPNSDC